MEPIAWPAAAAAALIDCGLALCIGCILALSWIGTMTGAADLRRGLGRVSAWAAAGVLAGLLSHLYLYTATMVGGAQLSRVVHALPAIVETHTGLMDMLSVGAAAVLTAVALVRVLAERSLSASYSLATLAILICRSATGHAASEGSFRIGELLQFAHLAGTFVWSGGVIVSALFLQPAIAESCFTGEFSLLRSLSRASFAAVLVIVLTGATKTYLGVSGQLHLITQSAWGSILLVKLGVIATALLLGASHFLFLRRRAGTIADGACVRLQRTLTAEALLLLFTLALSALLGATSPPES